MNVNPYLTKARTELAEAGYKAREGAHNTAYWCLWHAQQHIAEAMAVLKPKHADSLESVDKGEG